MRDGRVPVAPGMNRRSGHQKDRWVMGEDGYMCFFFVFRHTIFRCAVLDIDMLYIDIDRF